VIRSIGAAAAGLMAALLLAGCAVADAGATFDETQRDRDGVVVAPNDHADAFTLEVGDCFDDAAPNDDDTVSEVPIVPCDMPHANEVYLSQQVDDGDGGYPGDEAMGEQGDDICRPGFASFVGLDLGASALSFSYYYPSEETWTQKGDREILCYLFDPSTTVTGTLENAAR
jgi:hypothetical protein